MEKYNVKIKFDEKVFDDTIEATDEHEAVIHCIKEFCRNIEVYAASGLANQAITWTVEPVRQWLTAEEGLKMFEVETDVWAFRDGNVEKWYVNCSKIFYIWRNYDKTTLGWDKAHQPSYVMLRIEGEEPPAPPEVEPVKEPTLYEKILKICEGEGTGVFGGIWQRRQYQIWDEYHDLCSEAHEMAQNHALYKHTISDGDESFTKLICSYALMLAKDDENL